MASPLYRHSVDCPPPATWPIPHLRRHVVTSSRRERPHRCSTPPLYSLLAFFLSPYARAALWAANLLSLFFTFSPSVRRKPIPRFFFSPQPCQFLFFSLSKPAQRHPVLFPCLPLRKPRLMVPPCHQTGGTVPPRQMCDRDSPRRFLFRRSGKILGLQGSRYSFLPCYTWLRAFRPFTCFPSLTFGDNLPFVGIVPPFRPLFFEVPQPQGSPSAFQTAKPGALTLVFVRTRQME